MLTRLVISISLEESRALAQVAFQELRPVREQARFLLRSELARRGLLPSDPPHEPLKPAVPA